MRIADSKHAPHGGSLILLVSGLNGSALTQLVTDSGPGKILRQNNRIRVGRFGLTQPGQAILGQMGEHIRDSYSGGSGQLIGRVVITIKFNLMIIIIL